MTVRRAAPLIVAAVALVLVAVVLATRASESGAAVGLVVDVEASGLTDVRSFTLRTDDGAQTRYRIGSLENATEFPPSHLGEHRATGEPVRVFYRVESGERVAYRLEDAL
jgi:hypothetical protein